MHSRGQGGKAIRVWGEGEHCGDQLEQLRGRWDGA